jgi:hypothetical protein
LIPRLASLSNSSRKVHLHIAKAKLESIKT